MSKKTKLFIPCYCAFFSNGMMALVIGAILPYLIEEANINYSVAGGLLSAFAIGNLLASFISPFVMKLIGKKWTAVFLSMLIPLNLLLITTIPSIPVLYFAFILLGIGRGTVSITNNMVVNDYDGSPFALNLLHTVFAIGAFLAPFLTSVFTGGGFNWRYVIYTIIVLSTLACLGYALMPLENEKTKKQEEKGKEKYAFMKSVDFYIAGGILFFYLGVENCVNGWFVTYFKSIGIMSDAYATNLVSITWFLIMVGRLVTAYLSTKIAREKLVMINCTCTALFFMMMIATKELPIITLSIIGMGFFFAGIYPTGIANAGELIKGSASGMSILLAIAALGGIITPQIVGFLGDVIGLEMAIGFLVINALMMVILAIINVKRKKHIA